MYKLFYLLSISAGFFLISNLSYSLTLKKICHYQGVISDKIVLYFDKRPGYLSEPGNSINNLGLNIDNVKKINLILPYTIKSYRVKADSINKVKDGYSFNIQRIVKPIKGLNLEIEYDPKKIEFSYKTEVENLDSDLYALVLNYANKENLNLIKERTSPLRCLAMGKHQPRVMLDVKSQSCLRLINNLKELLEEQKYEVFIFSNNHLKNISKDSIVSSINLDYKPDVYMAIDFNKDSSYISHSKNDLIKSIFNKSKALSYNIKSLLEKHFQHNNLLKFEIIESHLANDYMLNSTEMPSVYLNLNVKDIEDVDDISQIIANGLSNYLQEVL